MEDLEHQYLSTAGASADAASLLNRVVIPKSDALLLKTIFVSEMEKGLETGLKGSSLQMENTYVTELLNGTEEGMFLALDLGGTNFRVMLLELSGGKILREDVSYYAVPDATRLGPGVELFDFLAECISDFCTKGNIGEDSKMPLGFTFSFPMEQSAVDEGLLVTWTKSFDCAGVVGEDAAKLLNEALKRKGGCVSNVRVSAILNDTTGTLVKGCYDDPDTVIGLILGTGCNGAYVERAENLRRQKFDEKKKVKEVIIDPEFGAFGDNGCLSFLRSPFDIAVDAASLFPGSFTYEKYFAGKYIGEVARRMLQALSEKGHLPSLPKIAEENALTAVHVSSIEQDSVDCTDKSCKELFTELGVKATVSDAHIVLVKYVCALLTQRCGLLVAVPLAVMISRLGGSRKKAKVAVTGSLYKFSPRLKGYLERFIREYLDRPEEVETETFLTDDGSGKGAGLVAAIAARLAAK